MLFNKFLSPCSHFVSHETSEKQCFQGGIKSEHLERNGLITKYNKLILTCLDLLTLKITVLL